LPRPKAGDGRRASLALLVALFDSRQPSKIALDAGGELVAFVLNESQRRLPPRPLAPLLAGTAESIGEARPLRADEDEHRCREQGDREPAHARILDAAASHALAAAGRALSCGAGYHRRMREVLADVRRWQARGEEVALATVVATRRSAPRPIGSKLAVSAGGEMAGSVSGGCVETDVYEHARAVLAGGSSRLVSYGIPDEFAFSVGLPCGGEIDVFVDRADPELLAQVDELLEQDRHGVLFTSLDGSDAGARELALPGDPQADAAIRRGRSHVLEREDRLVFADVFGPPPRLLVFGAVDTAEALCHAAQALGWRTIVADARPKFATAARVPSADELIVAWPDEALARVQPSHETAVVVLTHDDKFDLPALKGVLQTDAFYVGAIGSRRNQARRRERLAEAGVTEEQLERISGPCGLDIGADSPAETAVSILAEILATRAQRDGGRLQSAAGRIHAEVA